MKKKRIQLGSMTILFIVFAFLIASCGGAKEPSDGKPASGQPSAEQPADKSPRPSEPDDKPGKPTDQPVIAQLSFTRQEIALSPGSESALPFEAVLNDQSSLHPDQAEELIEFVSSLPEWIAVDEKGTVRIADTAEIGETATITARAGTLQAELAVTVKYALEDTIEMVDGRELPVVTNADSVAVVVNKTRSLPDGYAPDDLVEPNVPFSFSEKLEKRMLRKPAAEALEALFAKAKEDGIRLNAVSGYRSYNTQKSLFNWNINHYGEEHARRYVAFPGTSEHQTGLAMDVSSPSVGNALEESLADTVEGQWLAENAAEFGFIIRYPKGKEDITGYAYEPWHLRFVGKKIAGPIMEKGMTLEEYFSDAVPVSR